LKTSHKGTPTQTAKKGAAISRLSHIQIIFLSSADPASLAKMMQVERTVKSALRRHLLRANHPHVPGRVGPDRVGDVRQRGADAGARLRGVDAGLGDADPMRDYRRSVG
jgi:hypothetical protein